MVDFGNRLKTLRISNSLTQKDLASRLNITKSVISAYETGARLPSYDVLIGPSNIFHVTTDYLLGVEKKTELDLSGLSFEEKEALYQLVQAMKHRSHPFTNDNG